jgi:predicted ribosome quality control (RQC) complex YloA/Tae2 family protein
MGLLIDPRKTALQNAAGYYEKAKKFAKKAEGARKSLGKKTAKKTPKKKKAREKSKWFHEFHWFTSTNGFLCVAGKNAKQNEFLVAKHLDSADLFFHADVNGAPATILKKGSGAEEQDLLEAAQWACAYSRAWKGGSLVADAYAVEKKQVSKYSHGEFVGKGAFMIYGERKWFRNLPIRIKLLKEENRVRAVPAAHPGNGRELQPGPLSKHEAAAKIHEEWEGVSLSSIESVLPGNAQLV